MLDEIDKIRNFENPQEFVRGLIHSAKKRIDHDSLLSVFLFKLSNIDQEYNF